MREAAIPRHIAGCANPDARRIRRRLLIDVHDRKHNRPRVTVRLSRKATKSHAGRASRIAEAKEARADQSLAGARHGMPPCSVTVRAELTGQQRVLPVGLDPLDCVVGGGLVDHLDALALGSSCVRASQRP